MSGRGRGGGREGSQGQKKVNRLKGNEDQPYCVPYPNTKNPLMVAMSMLAATSCHEFLESFSAKDDCVTDLMQLTCASTFSTHKTIKVCDGSEIDFSVDDMARTVQVGLNFVGEEMGKKGKNVAIFEDADKKIECDGCDCTFKRDVKNDICPFFTTSKLDAKLTLKGIKFVSYDTSKGRKRGRDGDEDKYEVASFDDKKRIEFPAEQNIIALSNMPRVMARIEPIGAVPHDINLKSSAKESKLPKKCTSTKKKDPKRHLEAYDVLRQVSHRPTSTNNAISDRNLKGNSDEEDNFFCEDLFFDEGTTDTTNTILDEDVDAIDPIRIMCYSIASFPEVLEEPFEVTVEDMASLGFDMTADVSAATWTLFSYHFDGDGDGIVTNEDILAGCLSL